MSKTNSRNNGTTLWTDDAITGDQASILIGAQVVMRDAMKVRIRDEDGGPRLMLSTDTAALHKAQKAWLLAALDPPSSARRW